MRRSEEAKLMKGDKREAENLLKHLEELEAAGFQVKAVSSSQGPRRDVTSAHDAVTRVTATAGRSRVWVSRKGSDVLWWVDCDFDQIPALCDSGCEVPAEFVKCVTSENTGGNCMVDLIHLRNGMVVGVSEDCIVLYKDLQDFESGEADDRPIFHLVP